MILNTDEERDVWMRAMGRGEGCCRGCCRTALDAMLAEEPYGKAGVMRFSAITAFHPVMHQVTLRHWFGVEAKGA